METTQPPLDYLENDITTQPPLDYLDYDITTPNNIDTISMSERRNIFGKIVNKNNQPIYLVEVKNLSDSSQNITYTNSNGEFTIFASPEDNVRISKKGVGEKTINLTINDSYTLENKFELLPIILGVLGFIYLVITCVFIGVGSKLREKETDSYKRKTLLIFILLSVLGIPFQPVFLIVLIILCALYHKELQENIPVASQVTNKKKYQGNYIPVTERSNQNIKRSQLLNSSQVTNSNFLNSKRNFQGNQLQIASRVTNKNNYQRNIPIASLVNSRNNNNYQRKQILTNYTNNRQINKNII